MNQERREGAGPSAGAAIDAEFLAERRRLAEKAAPSPWTIEWSPDDNDPDPWYIYSANSEYRAMIETDCGTYGPDPDSARHIAANDPATVLAWVEETERLMDELKVHQERFGEREAEVIRLRAEAERTCELVYDAHGNASTACGALPNLWCGGCGGRIVEVQASPDKPGSATG